MKRRLRGDDNDVENMEWELQPDTTFKYMYATWLCFFSQKLKNKLLEYKTKAQQHDIHKAHLSDEKTTILQIQVHTTTHKIGLKLESS